MDLISSYKLKEENANYSLIVYLNVNDSEFADELSYFNKGYKSYFNKEREIQLFDYVRRFIKEKFPDVKITVCKVMLGSMLVTTFLIPSGKVFAANNQSALVENAIINYTVQSGDTLWNISQKFDVSIDEIKSINNLSSDLIYVNQLLKIPNKNVNNITHEVKSGDTLYKIAQTYGTTIAKIKKDNNLTSDIIYLGQKIIITQDVNKNEVSTYVVKLGDTLWKISQKFNISVVNIKSLNNLTSDTIYIGQVLKIKGESTVYTEPTITYTTHKVQAGETVWSISIDYGIPMSELLEVNGLSSNSYLSFGQIIKIPIHHIPVKSTIGPQYGEYLDWWTESQYVFKINDTAKLIDFKTGKIFMIKRTIGANHADCEPLTASDTEIAKGIWDSYSWSTRAVLVEVNGRKIAASMSFMPHGIQYIEDNNFDGHFDIHFLNSTRHKDGQIDLSHQDKVKIAAGIK